MKQINVWFEKEEHEFISKIKDEHGGNWHDFLLDLARAYHEMKGGETHGKKTNEKN